MHEQPTAEAPRANGESQPTHTRYDSNPFTATLSGIQKLIRTNAQTVVGVAFFNILLFAVMGLTVIAVFMAVIAFVVKRSPELTSMPDNTVLDFLSTVNDTGIYLTWAIGVVIYALTTALTQAMQLNLTVSAAKGSALKFGALLKTSLGSVLPILGFIALVILGLLGIILVLALLGPVIGYALIPLAFIALVAVVYGGLRLSYATYSIVDKHVGPITAMKDSWALSSGHLIETVGSAAVAGLIVAIPSLILSALARVTEGTPMVSGLFSLLDMALLVVLVIGAAMSLAERYVQIRAVSTKQIESAPLSPFNYLAIVLIVFLMPILSALSPQSSNSGNELIPFNTTPTSNFEDSIYRTN